MEFMRNKYMEDWEAVIFLKTKCLPTHHQQSISNLNKTSTIFSLLDTQYGSKNVELGKIKRKIIGDAPIANTLTFNMTQRLERVKDILKQALHDITGQLPVRPMLYTLNSFRSNFCHQEGSGTIFKYSVILG